MTKHEVSWCTDCQDYLPVSEFDQSELKKRSRHHRRCRVHAKAHLDWKGQQKHLMQNARRRVEEYAHSPTKVRKWTFGLELARHSLNEAQFNQVNQLVSRARGAKGLGYVERVASLPGGDAFEKELPQIRKSLTDHALTQRLDNVPKTERVAKLVEYLAWNGPWWPYEALGSQQNDPEILPESVVRGMAKAEDEKNSRMKAFREARKYQQLAAEYALKIQAAAWKAWASHP